MLCGLSFVAAKAASWIIVVSSNEPYCSSLLYHTRAMINYFVAVF